jgi:hypothetical protein
MTAETKTYKLKTTLSLVWKQGDQYEASVSVELTDTCFHPGALRKGLPPKTNVVPEVEPLTFDITHEDGKACGEQIKVVTEKIIVNSSPGKTQVTAFAVVNGAVAGSDTKSFPRKG